jgi:hypothetical protein
MELQTALIDMYLSQLEDVGTPVEKIVADVIQDSQLFVFSEILSHPRIAAVNSILVDQLRMMAFGSYHEYARKYGESDKMRMLTILGMFNQLGWCNVPLSTLRAAVGLEDQHMLATYQLLIEMGRKKLIDVRIDERNGTVNVTNIHIFRDVGSISETQLKQFKDYIDYVRSIIH